VYSKIDEEIEHSQEANEKNLDYMNKKEICQKSILEKMQNLSEE
jgi:hypothetical protein